MSAESTGVCSVDVDSPRWGRRPDLAKERQAEQETVLAARVESIEAIACMQEGSEKPREGKRAGAKSPVRGFFLELKMDRFGKISAWRR